MSMIPMTPSAATPSNTYFPCSFDGCESCPGPSAAIETIAQFGFVLPKEALLATYSLHPTILTIKPFFRAAAQGANLFCAIANLRQPCAGLQAFTESA